MQVSSTRRAIRRLKDALRRRKQDQTIDERAWVREGKASRVVMPMWKRTYGEVARPEIVDAEYLKQVVDRDWDNAVKGRNGGDRR